MALVGGGKC